MKCLRINFIKDVHTQKTQYFEYVSSPQIDLKIQCTPNQISGGFFSLEINRPNLEFRWKCKGSNMGPLKEKNKNLKTYTT